MSPSFALLVPVKSLDRAKSRLHPDHARAGLMRAFALDALAAASACPAVARVYVVTDEPGLADHTGTTRPSGPGTDAATVVEVERLPDEGGGDLNQTLRRAEARVRAVHPGLGVAAMCADLPALHTEDLTRALTWEPADGTPAVRRFVADAAGTGTTLLLAAAGTPLDPAFGPGSAARHAASGATAVTATLPTLRADVDTAADLDAARALGLGPRSRAADALLARDPAAPRPT